MSILFKGRRPSTARYVRTFSGLVTTVFLFNPADDNFFFHNATLKTFNRLGGVRRLFSILKRGGVIMYQRIDGAQ